MSDEPLSQDSDHQSGDTQSSDGAMDDWPSADEVVGRLDRLWGPEQALLAPDFYDLADKSIGPYRLQKLIGRGSFGVVYLALDEQLGREVAIKLPRPEILFDEERLRRFQVEATTAASLDHPYIIPVYRAELESPTPYIVSAYCVGSDLGSWLAERSAPVGFESAARFIIHLSEAVQHAHRQGVLHRDLKPGNVLLEPRPAGTELAGTEQQRHSLDNYTPRLTDFGLAKLVQESLHDTRSSVMIGTPLYMAPEQLRDSAEHETAATDVYAIGILLFELLTQQTPREGLGYFEGLEKLRAERAPSLRSIRAETPDSLDTITAKCLEQDPQERYPSADALSDDLQRFLNGDPIQAKPVGLKGRFLRWTKRPERLTIAGYFSLWHQCMVLAWFFVVLVMMVWQDYFTEVTMQRYLLDVLSLSLLQYLPVAWLGWRLAKAKRWSYLSSTIANLIQLAILAYSSVNATFVFEYHYTSASSKISTYSALITCSLLVVSLHLLAFPAWLRMRRERREAGDE